MTTQTQIDWASVRREAYKVAQGDSPNFPLDEFVPVLLAKLDQISAICNEAHEPGTLPVTSAERLAVKIREVLES